VLCVVCAVSVCAVCVLSCFSGLVSSRREEEEEVWMGMKEVDFLFFYHTQHTQNDRRNFCFEKSPRRPFTINYSIRIHILKLKLYGTRNNFLTVFSLQLSTLCKIHQFTYPQYFWFSSYRPFHRRDPVHMSVRYQDCLR
jgi:hypothetical protein